MAAQKVRRAENCISRREIGWIDGFLPVVDEGEWLFRDLVKGFIYPHTAIDQSSLEPLATQEAHGACPGAGG